MDGHLFRAGEIVPELVYRLKLVGAPAFLAVHQHAVFRHRERRPPVRSLHRQRLLHCDTLQWPPLVNVRGKTTANNDGSIKSGVFRSSGIRGNFDQLFSDWVLPSAPNGNQ